MTKKISTRTDKQKQASRVSHPDTFYLTLLSVISCIAVVYLHADYAIFGDVTQKYWLSANVIHSIFIYAVPIFFMITGATLLNYSDRYPTKVFFKKRLKKVIIPFVAWSLIGLVYMLISGSAKFESIDPKYLFNGILGAKFVDIYWYFPALIGVYLCLPLFSGIDKARRKEVLTYLAVAGFVFNILLPFVNSVFKFGLALPISVQVISSYLFYTVVGFLIKEYGIPKKLKPVIYVLGAAALVSIIVGTYFTSVSAGKLDRFYTSYNNLPCTLYAIALFVLAKDLTPKIVKEGNIIARVINFLGRYTFSIYLIHIFVRRILVNVIGLDHQSILFRLFAPIPMILISIAITWILRKIKFVKEIVPE